MKMLMILILLAFFTINLNAYGIDKVNDKFIDKFADMGGSSQGVDILKQELAPGKGSYTSAERDNIEKRRKMLNDKVADIVGGPSFDVSAYMQATKDLAATFPPELMQAQKGYISAFSKMSLNDRKIASKVIKDLYDDMEDMND